MLHIFALFFSTSSRKCKRLKLSTLLLKLTSLLARLFVRKFFRSGLASVSERAFTLVALYAGYVTTLISWMLAMRLILRTSIFSRSSNSTFSLVHPSIAKPKLHPSMLPARTFLIRSVASVVFSKRSSKFTPIGVLIRRRVPALVRPRTLAVSWLNNARISASRHPSTASGRIISLKSLPVSVSPKLSLSELKTIAHPVSILEPSPISRTSIPPFSAARSVRTCTPLTTCGKWLPRKDFSFNSGVSIISAPFLAYRFLLAVLCQQFHLVPTP